MPDLPLLTSTACALAIGTLVGWLWARWQMGGERERWQRTLQLSIDEARTDPLTKLWNRRAFDEQLAIQTAVAERYGTPCAIVLIDIDDLKSLNDRGGHQAGDAALQQLADMLRDSSRAADLAMRLGGDEFALLLPQTDVAGALVVATRIADRLAAPQQESTTVGTPPLELQASLGVAAHFRDETAADLVKRADLALYQAKQAGGRRVCMHDGAAVVDQCSIDKSIL